MSSLSKDHKPAATTPIQPLAILVLVRETQVAVQAAQQPPAHPLLTPHHLAPIQHGTPEQQALAVVTQPPLEHLAAILLPIPHEPQAVVPLRELAPAAPLPQEAVLAALPPQVAAEPQAVPLPQEPATEQTHAETHLRTTHCTNNSS